ncbi:TolC family protein [Asticcacaulis sp. EMRT-3]|uniref:TolC family protein n=1 Tax=Asticcacaulis sp. EMRT-3 TaxID=3040349 RepID=UPI0032C2493C
MIDLRLALFCVVGLLGLSACATYSPMQKPLESLGATAPMPSSVPTGNLLSLALSRSPEVAAARAHLASTQAELKAARQMPTITLALSSEYSKAADSARPWLWGMAVDIPFDTNARRGSRITAASVEVMKARATLAEALWQTRQNLREAQVKLASARAIEVAARALLDQRRALEAALQQRMAAGEDAHDGLDTARIATLQTQQTLIQTQGEAQAALSDLAHALDADTSRVYNLPPPQSGNSIDLNDDIVLYARPDIQTAVANYDLSESALRLAVAQQYPDITVSPGYIWERGVVKLPFNLSLNLPPLDGNRANIDAADQARLASGKSLEATVKTALAYVARTHARWESAELLQRQIAVHDVPLANEIARHAEAAASEGEADCITLLQARIAALETNLALAQARATADQARLDLEDARHIPFDPLDARDLTAALMDMTK